LSKTGAIYGCTAGELLSQFVKSERKPFDQIDLQPPGSVLSHIGYPNRVFQLARFGINWLAPMPLGSDRQPDTVRFKVQHADLGSRKRTAVLDEDAGLTRPRGPERIQPENCNMEPARSRRTGILQVKEFSTGKGIKPPIEARFLQVKEKRQRAEQQCLTLASATPRTSSEDIDR
jgi:hypothetical protein